jgi:Tfp pilus assembly protein PilN
MRAINLLPRDETDGRRGPALPVLVGCVGTVLVTAILAVMFLSASSSTMHQKRALQDAQAEYAAIPAPPTPSPIDKSLPQQQQTRVTALATALGQRVAWDRLLREVSQVVPSDVWLVTLNALSPTIAPVPATDSLPTGFIISGCTYSQESVARFLARLDVVPDLSQMTLGKSASDGTAAGGGGAAAATGGGTGGTCPSGMFTFTLQGLVRTSGTSS